MAEGFREIEHKFLVGEDFHLEAFRKALERLGPESVLTEHVRDRYFVLRSEPGFIYRHRYDGTLQQLTVKSIGGDAEDRLEVNLDLGHQKGDQEAAVRRFLGARGIEWEGTLHKDIEVYYFPDCEIVHYRARTDDREVHVVEFEARGITDLQEARAILERYEQHTGFKGTPRESRSLAELLFDDVGAWLAG
jgi:hypothetical protein